MHYNRFYRLRRSSISPQGNSKVLVTKGSCKQFERVLWAICQSSNMIQNNFSGVSENGTINKVLYRVYGPLRLLVGVRSDDQFSLAPDLYILRYFVYA